MLQSNTQDYFAVLSIQSASAFQTISGIRWIGLTAELSAQPFRIPFANDNPVWLTCGLADSEA